MKISLNWLKDYVKIPEDLKLKQLVYDLTMSTVEVEGAEELAKKFEYMVVGVIKEVLPHGDADKLKLCMTDIGDGNIHQIVCGGINLEENMKVIVALPGAMVRWHGEGELVPIKIAKVRGEESYGMICASSEVGLGDLFPADDDAEIVDLKDFDAEAGCPLSEALGIDDIILEIDNKSITNRPDLWGHYGMARELAAIYDLPLAEIKKYSSEPMGDLLIEIDDEVRCPRYIGARIEGVANIPSPFKIQRRIWSVGMRPINAIVDITNYVMLATGNPTHAFDADDLTGDIRVRLAKKEENITLLDGRELSLTEEDLLITDDKGALALAGVMGGAGEGISSKTEKVILEVANFEPLGVRKTAARYEARTEAAARYEKGIDPDRCELALSMAMNMFTQFYPDMKLTGFHDNYPESAEIKEIDLSLSWLEKRLGKKIPEEEIVNQLEKLGFKVRIDDDILHVTPPSWRSTGDVSVQDDILEEVARMHGYDKFETIPIITTISSSINQLDMDLDRKIREYLAFRCGMQEIFTYPWVNATYQEAIYPNAENILRLSAPPSPELSQIRMSLLPNMCKVISDNLRYNDNFALFEVAEVFFDKDYNNSYDEKESLPLGRKHVAGSLVENSKKIDKLFRRAKGIIEELSRYTHIEEISFEANDKPDWANEEVWLNIYHNKEKIGDIGLLSKKASLQCGIKQASVVLFEIDIDSLSVLNSRTNSFTEIPEYPMTEYDISILVDSSTKWKDILASINGSENKLVHGVSYVGEYVGEQVPEGKKSVTCRLIIGSVEKTLTSEEIDGAANSILKNLEKTIGAKLRN